MSEVVHLCPPGGSARTPCCGRTPFELPLNDRMALDYDQVTCPGMSQYAGGPVEIDRLYLVGEAGAETFSKRRA
jgi:hypothetical protein